jgi:hypothetical protein
MIFLLGNATSPLPKPVIDFIIVLLFCCRFVALISSSVKKGVKSWQR